VAVGDTSAFKGIAVLSGLSNITPSRPSHVWSIRTKLQMKDRKRDLALFNLAIDSKLRGCDVVAVRVDDVAPSSYAERLPLQPPTNSLISIRICHL
jgi:hypothetical protein